MIVRTVTVHCDEKRCMFSTRIDPANTQIYVTLIKAGWSVGLDARDIETLCPTHNPDKEAPK